MAEKNTLPTDRSRLEYIDILRIIAIFFVLYAHASQQRNILFRNYGTALYLPSLLLHTCIGLTIPIFFGISGAMLLGREESYSTLLRRRVLRYAIVIVVTQAVQYVFMFRDTPAALYPAYFIEILYSDLFAAHLWFLYAYLGYLLVLPFLRKMIAGMELKDYIYLFVLCYAVKLLKVAGYFIFGGRLQLNRELDTVLFVTLDTVLYTTAGYFIHRKIDINTFRGRKLFLANIAGVTLFVLTMLLVHLRCEYTGWTDKTEADAFYYALAPLPACVLYLDLKLLLTLHPMKAGMSKFISAVGACSFGVYLFENIYRYYTSFVFTALRDYMPRLFACLAQCFAALILGTAVTWLLRLIPGVKKFI